jgi:PAS domain S-box-containing protein
MKMKLSDTIKKAKFELQQSVDSVQKLICIIQKDGSILRSNRAVERWTNLHYKNVVGESFHAAIHPNCVDNFCYLKKILELSGKVIDSGIGLDFRTFDQLLNFDVHIQLNPIEIQRGQRNGRALTIIIQDLRALNRHALENDSELKSLKNLSQSENRELEGQRDNQLDFFDHNPELVEMIKKEWELAIDSLEEMLFLVNSHGDVIRANRAIEKWKLGAVGAVGGKKFHDLIHRGCRDKNCYLKKFNSTIMEVVMNGKPFEHQFFDAHLKKQLSYQVNKVFSDDLPDDLVVVSVNNIKQIHSSSSNIESLKKNLNKKIELKSLALQKLNKKLQIQIEKSNQAKANLKESHHAYLNLLDTMSEGVVVQDTESKIVYVNRKMSKMLGHPKSKLIGQVLESFLDRNDCIEMSGFDDKILHESGQLNRLNSANGKKLWVKVSAHDLLKTFISSNGQSLVITDINDFVESQKKLMAADEQLRLLSQRVLQAQEIERKRIAFELHDGLGQTLSAVKFYVENTINSLSLNSKTSGDRLGLVVTKLQDAVDEVRRISMDLRPSMLDDIGVIATLKWFRREMSLLYPAIKFDFLVSNIKESDIVDARKTQIFRITQEAVNNACKYSKGDYIKFSLGRIGQKLVLKISDNGQGLDTENVMFGNQDRKSLGLVSMRERTETSGGAFQIKSDGEGLLITCRWDFN